MKAVIFVLTAVFALTYALPTSLQDGGKVHIPDKCSDVLAVKVCDNLEQLAKRLKLKGEDVTKAVVEAVKQGKSSSIEIYNAAKDFLIKEVMSKKCEDFITVENCAKLRKVAAVLKVNAAKVEKFVIKAVAEGAVQAKDIYAKVMEYYKAEIVTKKCEDFLSASQCTGLRKLASKLKVNFIDLENAIKEAYLESLGDAKAMYERVVATLKDYALNTKCEDLLNPDLCAALRRYAQITKVQFPVLMEKAVDLLIKGYDVSKSLLNAIYKLVDTFYDCTDIFDKASCEKLYKVASYVGVAKEKVEEFLKKYVPIAIEKGKDIVNDFPTLLKDLGNYLKNLLCDKTPFCYNVQQQQQDADSLFADSGFIDMNLIRQKVKEYIEIKYPGLQDKVKQKIMGLVNKAQNIRELVKDAVVELVAVGGESAGTIRKILKDLIQNIKSILTPPQQSDELDSVDVHFEAIKQKIISYIEKKFPGLQDKVKEKVVEIVKKAKSIPNLIAKAVNEILKVGGESADVIKRILKDLLRNIQNIVKPSGDATFVAKRDVDFEKLKQKLLDYVEKKYPGVQDDVKQTIKDVISKARSKLNLLTRIANSIVSKAANQAKELRKVLLELLAKVNSKMQ